MSQKKTRWKVVVAPRECQDPRTGEPVTLPEVAEDNEGLLPARLIRPAAGEGKTFVQLQPLCSTGDRSFSRSACSRSLLEKLDVLMDGSHGTANMWNAYLAASAELDHHAAIPDAHGGGCAPVQPEECPTCAEAIRVLSDVNRALGWLTHEGCREQAGDAWPTFAQAVLAAFGAGYHAGILQALGEEKVARSGRKQETAGSIGGMRSADVRNERSARLKREAVSRVKELLSSHPNWSVDRAAKKVSAAMGNDPLLDDAGDQVHTEGGKPLNKTIAARTIREAYAKALSGD